MTSPNPHQRALDKPVDTAGIRSALSCGNFDRIAGNWIDFCLDKIDALRLALDAANKRAAEAEAGRKLDLQGAAGHFKVHERIWQEGAAKLRARAEAAEQRVADLEADTLDADAAATHNLAVSTTLLARAEKAEQRAADLTAERDEAKDCLGQEMAQRRENLIQVAELKAERDMWRTSYHTVADLAEELEAEVARLRQIITNAETAGLRGDSGVAEVLEVLDAATLRDK